MKADTIVVGYDGSSHARRALEASISLVPPSGTVHVVVAYHAPSASDLAAIMRALPDEYKTGLDLMATPRAHLRDAMGLLDARGVKAEAHFIEARPSEAILDTADEVGADLVIVGSRGLGRATRVLRGSVSTRIANHAKTSYLVVNEPGD